MSCGMGVIKYLLFIFNFIFAVCGLAILTLSIVAYVKVSNINDINLNLDFPTITLIVIGSIIFVISFFGCCGAIRESHCMTITFASLLLFILIIQVAITVYIFVVVTGSDSEEKIEEYYRKIFARYYEDKEDADIVNTIQSNLSCCGINSYRDFTKDLPSSCCANENQTCTADTVYKTGCIPAINDWLKLVANVLGGIAVGVGVVELIGIIFALCLANSIKNVERRGYRV